jgi:hypothetical protein
MKSIHYTTAFIFIFILTVVLGYIKIATNNVPYGDDLVYFEFLKEVDLIQYCKSTYFTGEMYISSFFQLWLMKYVGTKFSLSLLNIIVFLSGILCASLMTYELGNKKSKLKSLLFGALIISLIYSSTRAVGMLGNQFWGISQGAYILPFNYLFLAVYFYKKHINSRRPIHLHLSGVLVLIFATTRPHYAAYLFLYGFTSLTLINLYYNKTIIPLKTFSLKTYLQSVVKRRNIVLLIYFLVGFISMITTPGISGRINMDANINNDFFTSNTIRSLIIGHYHFYLSIFTNPRFLICLAIIAIIAFDNPVRNSLFVQRDLIVTHFIIFSIGLSFQILLFVLLFNTPIYQGRIHAMAELLFLLLFTHLSVFTSSIIKHKTKNQFNTASKVVFISLILLTINYIHDQITITNKFKEQYDKRINYIIASKSNLETDTVYVPKLPPSGILGIAELSSKKEVELFNNSNHRSAEFLENKRYEIYYDLKFKIYASEKNEFITK